MDNRIPPYQMDYNEARKRNALPVTDTQYGKPGSNGVYNYWDELDLNAIAPAGAASAEITLLYQGTSWEYIQFLEKANTGENAFLGMEGQNMLEAWINAEVNLPEVLTIGGDKKMAPPVVMATASWGVQPTGNNEPVCQIDTPAGNVTVDKDQSVNYTGTVTDSDGSIAGINWDFPGGTPASSANEDPGNVSYSTAGTYTASLTATDNEGASCSPVSVQITVNGAPVACSSYTSRDLCKADASCRWNNRNKVCQDR